MAAEEEHPQSHRFPESSMKPTDTEMEKWWSTVAEIDAALHHLLYEQSRMMKFMQANPKDKAVPFMLGTLQAMGNYSHAISGFMTLLNDYVNPPKKP
jgi:hypothetical protein